MFAVDREISERSRPPLNHQIWLLMAFWLVTYGVFTVRGRLLDDPLAWISPKRFLAITTGTLFLWLTVKRQAAVKGRTLRWRLAWVGFTTSTAAAALLVLRTALDGIANDNGAGLTDEIRWLLIWVGYFLAWVGLDVAFSAATLSEGPVITQLKPPRPATSASLAEDDALWAHTGTQRLRVPTKAIERVESEGNYVRIYSDGRSGLLRMSMSEAAQRLGTDEFARIHRSVLCRKSAIIDIKRLATGAYVALLSSGVQVPVGRRTGQNLLEELRASRR